MSAVDQRLGRSRRRPSSPSAAGAAEERRQEVFVRAVRALGDARRLAGAPLVQCRGTRRCRRRSATRRSRRTPCVPSADAPGRRTGSSALPPVGPADTDASCRPRARRRPARCRCRGGQAARVMRRTGEAVARDARRTRAEQLAVAAGGPGRHQRRGARRRARRCRVEASVSAAAIGSCVSKNTREPSSDARVEEGVELPVATRRPGRDHEVIAAARALVDVEAVSVSPATSTSSVSSHTFEPSAETPSKNAS